MFRILFTVLILATSLTAQAETFKVATLAPDGTAWMREMRNTASQIESRTGGKVKFKFYPGGIMGNEKSVLRKIRLGQLQGGALTSGGISKISPKNQIYGLPFKFLTYDEVDFIRSRMDQMIIKGVEQNGFVTFGLAEGGFTYLFSQTPVENINQLKGKKVWIPEGDDTSRTLMDIAGMSPTALPLTDVLTGLQTGLIDVVASTPSFAIALQWHSKVKYLTLHPVLYSIGAFVISKKAFNKLSKTDQAIVKEELTSVFKKLNKINRQDNVEALAALKKYGIKFIDPGPGAEKELSELSTKTANSLLSKGAYTKAVLNKLDNDLASFRKKLSKK